MTHNDEKNWDPRSLTTGEKLLNIYEEAGFQVHTGLSSYHLNHWRDAGFTGMKKDGRPLHTGGGGLSWHEIPCLELLSRCIAAERILIIGNSFGWSTLLMSLLWPAANVAAMDIGVQPPHDKVQATLERVLQWLRGDVPPINPKPTYGIELTNELAEKHHLKARAILSSSPEDVSRVAEKHLGGPPDFVFIDGYHIPPQVILDFDACYEVAAKNCVYLFHDVVNWKLRGAFEDCQRKSGLRGGILWRTPSGMGLLYPESAPEVRRVVHAFGDQESELEYVKARLPRWKRASAVERAVLHNKLLKQLKDMVIKPGTSKRK